MAYQQGSERLVAAQRAARAVGDAAAELWRQLTIVADAAVTDQSLDVLYADALAIVMEVLDADSVALLLANEAQDALVARVSLGLGEDRTVGLQIGAGQGMAGQVLVTKQPLIIEDLSTVTLVSPALREHGLRSVTAVPIMSEKTVLGVLHVASCELRHFSEADTELLEFLADRLAVAFDRVRLFERSRQLADISAFFAETAKIMAEASDFTQALDRLAGAALPAFGDICLIDIVEDGHLKRLVAKHHDPERQHLVDRLRSEYPPEPSGDHPAVKAIRLGQTSWAPFMNDAFLRATTRDESHYALTKALRFRSYLAVPIGSQGEVVGSLTLVSCSRSFSAQDVDFAECLAQQVGAVAANAQQLDMAARTSHILQAALLPITLPDIPGLLVSSRYAAATKSLEVGGDFYDLMLLADDLAWFMIGDVEGHDRGAAALMGQLRSAARVLACQGKHPDELISALQSVWRRVGFDRIATALIGQVDVTTGVTTLASAGHYPPLLVRPGGAEFVAVQPSPPLGAPFIEASPWRGELHIGELLLLYTDGVMSERKLGVERGMEVLADCVVRGEIDPPSVCDRVIGAHTDHDDDIALLAIQRQSPPDVQS